MTRIGIKELKRQASRIVQEVREAQAEYVITHQGKPVAVLQPYTEKDATREQGLDKEQSLAEMKRLAHEVAQSWVSPKSAVELLEEQRR